MSEVRRAQGRETALVVFGERFVRRLRRAVLRDERRVRHRRLPDGLLPVQRELIFPIIGKVSAGQTRLTALTTSDEQHGGVRACSEARKGCGLFHQPQNGAEAPFYPAQTTPYGGRFTF